MSRTERRWITAAIAACVTLGSVIPLAQNLPLLDPDEGIHATIALEMVERRDLLHPTMLGQPFLDKPALFSAAQAISLALFGKVEWAIRLPGVLFHLFAAATTGLLASRMFERSRLGGGPLAALAYLSMGMPAALVLAPAHDVAGVGFLNLFLLSLWESDRSPSATSRLKYVAFAAVWAGLALLAKGLIGVATVSVGYVAFRLWVGRHDVSGTAACAIRFSAVLLGGALIAAPWFLSMDAFAAEHGAPGYLRYYFIERHFGGYVSGGQKHGSAPWWYYLPCLTAATLPWATYAVLGLTSRCGVRRTAEPSELQPVVLLSGWYVIGALFLSAAGSKLVTYTEPLYPPLAVLAADGCLRLLKDVGAGRSRTAFLAMMRFGMGFGAVFATVALAEIGAVVGAETPLGGIVAVSGVSAFGLLGWWLLGRGRQVEALAIGATMVCGFLACTVAWPVAAVAPRYSQRDAAEVVTALRPTGSVVLAGERIASFGFYPPGEIRLALRSSKEAGSRWADATVVVLAKKDAAEFLAADGPNVRTVGRYRVLSGSAARAWVVDRRRTDAFLSTSAP